MLAVFLTFGCAAASQVKEPVQLSPAATYVLNQVNVNGEKHIEILKEKNDGVTMWLWVDSFLPELPGSCDHVAIIRIQPDGNPAEIMHIFNAENVSGTDPCSFADEAYEEYLKAKEASEEINRKRGGI
jgi:hypothetical protein